MIHLQNIMKTNIKKAGCLIVLLGVSAVAFGQGAGPGASVPQPAAPAVRAPAADPGKPGGSSPADSPKPKAVPEPSTLALGLMGAGIIGSLMYLRRQPVNRQDS